MPMMIGQLASEAGLNIQTVRYYERRGLVRGPRANQRLPDSGNPR